MITRDYGFLFCHELPPQVVFSATSFGKFFWDFFFPLTFTFSLAFTAFQSNQVLKGISQQMTLKCFGESRYFFVSTQNDIKREKNKTKHLKQLEECGQISNGALHILSKCRRNAELGTSLGFAPGMLLLR